MKAVLHALVILLCIHTRGNAFLMSLFRWNSEPEESTPSPVPYPPDYFIRDENEADSFYPENIDVTNDLDHQIYAARIKATILEKLGLTAVPNVTIDRNDIPDVLLIPDIEYEQDQDQKTDESSPIKEVITLADKVDCVDPVQTTASVCIHIDVRDFPQELVGSATLYIHKQPDQRDRLGRQLFVITDQGTKRQDLARESTDVKEGWIKVELKWATQRWLHRRELNRGIRIQCTTCHRRGSPIDVSGSKRPFLVIQPVSSERRHKRQVSDFCQGNTQGCCLENFEFNFASQGMSSFIVKPESFFPNKCRGSCDVRVDPGSMNRAVNLYSTIMLRMLSERPPCCAPDKMDRLSIMYYRDGAFVKQDIPDMIARSCGCH